MHGLTMGLFVSPSMCGRRAWLLEFLLVLGLEKSVVGFGVILIGQIEHDFLVVGWRLALNIFYCVAFVWAMWRLVAGFWEGISSSRC